MAAFNKFQPFVLALASKQHNLGTDTLKAMLSNTLPLATQGLKTDITQIAAGNGYAADGPVVAQTSSAQTGGTYKLVLADTTVTASGGTIGPFQYVVLYNSTSGLLIGWYDYGSALTLNPGDQFILDFDGTNGVLTLT